MDDLGSVCVGVVLRQGVPLVFEAECAFLARFGAPLDRFRAFQQARFSDPWHSPAPLARLPCHPPGGSCPASAAPLISFILMYNQASFVSTWTLPQGNRVPGSSRVAARRRRGVAGEGRSRHGCRGAATSRLALAVPSTLSARSGVQP